MADLSFYMSPLSEEIREEGRAQPPWTEHLGRAQSLAEAVLRILDVRGISTTKAVRNRITACLDSELLRQWLVRAVHATTAEDIFGEETPADR
ncbi:hypothetical protein ACWD04_15835 [Streptomyces sp. NPDC002911]